MCQGVILAIFRFKEPVYLSMVKCQVYEWFGHTNPYEYERAKELSS